MLPFYFVGEKDKDVAGRRVLLFNLWSYIFLYVLEKLNIFLHFKRSEKVVKISILYPWDYISNMTSKILGSMFRNVEFWSKWNFILGPWRVLFQIHLFIQNLVVSR